MLENASLPLYRRLLAGVAPCKKRMESCGLANRLVLYVEVPLAEDSGFFAIAMACPVPGSEVVSATNLASGG